jgi:hypothetical protein
VDVKSILLNVPPRHAAKYNLPVKKCPTLTTRNTSNSKRDLRSFHYQVIQSVGKMFRDLFRSDNAKVNATLDVLNHNSMKDNKIYDKL